jgi:hypothetical protein
VDARVLMSGEADITDFPLTFGLVQRFDDTVRSIRKIGIVVVNDAAALGFVAARVIKSSSVRRYQQSTGPAYPR